MTSHIIFPPVEERMILDDFFRINLPEELTWNDIIPLLYQANMERQMPDGKPHQILIHPTVIMIVFNDPRLEDIIINDFDLNNLYKALIRFVGVYKEADHIYSKKRRDE